MAQLFGYGRAAGARVADDGVSAQLQGFPAPALQCFPPLAYRIYLIACHHLLAYLLDPRKRHNLTYSEHC
jgi:hypothetical protein